MMGVTHRRQKNAAVMMVTCLLRAGLARRKEGRKSSTKEELMLPRAIAPGAPWSPAQQPLPDK